MEEERIKAIKALSELTSVRDIQVFRVFANFYRRFIQGFSKSTALLTSMLKTTSSAANVKTPLKATGNLIFLTSEAKLAFSH